MLKENAHKQFHLRYGKTSLSNCPDEQCKSLFLNLFLMNLFVAENISGIRITSTTSNIHREKYIPLKKNTIPWRHSSLASAEKSKTQPIATAASVPKREA